MKYYMVQNVYEHPVEYNEWFLVKANTKKEALDKVYQQNKDEFTRKDFKVYTLEEMYEDSGDVAVIR